MESVESCARVGGQFAAKLRIDGSSNRHSLPVNVRRDRQGSPAKPQSMRLTSTRLRRYTSLATFTLFKYILRFNTLAAATSIYKKYRNEMTPC
jgi:hypothetical protein